MICHRKQRIIEPQVRFSQNDVIPWCCWDRNVHKHWRIISGVNFGCGRHMTSCFTCAACKIANSRCQPCIALLHLFPEEHVEGVRHSSSATCDWNGKIVRIFCGLPAFMAGATRYPNSICTKWICLLRRIILQGCLCRVSYKHPAVTIKRYKSFVMLDSYYWKAVRSQHIRKAMHNIISKSISKIYQLALRLCLSPGGKVSRTLAMTSGTKHVECI